MFDIIEPLQSRWRPFVPKNLLVDKTHYPEAKLVRLLIGTAALSAPALSANVQQNRNLSDARGDCYSKVSSKTIKDALSQICDIKQFSSYLDRTGADNYSFFSVLLDEYCWYFYQQDKGSGLPAFLHLYRILERISYAFPLIHASSSKSFTGTYNELSGYFKRSTSGEYGGELKFFKVFSERIFEESMLDASVDLCVSEPDPEKAEKIYQGLKKVLCDENFNQSWNCDDTRLQLDNTYSSLLSTIINLRNRYFHFAVGGQTNISSSDLHVPDMFFLEINPVLINWITMIYFEVLKSRVDAWA
ncbi:protein of unknown function [uncultured Woeseiaceae bacterium]|uniref:Uncharacterized protein n=1 Tax=uncultured Woeseiaceae bacterium TaxID=1983305 RepID=A0A7D9D2M4_9GAMM|nr:protein of unknown function [uncultured Woeseiaceae bacterium]